LGTNHSLGTGRAGSNGSRRPPADAGVLEGYALPYGRSGLSTIPIARDGSKSPCIQWGLYGGGIKDKKGNVVMQPRLPTEDEVRGWWSGKSPPGVAITYGKVSGNAELIDCDRLSLFAPFCQLVEAEAPGLIARLTQIKTPGKDDDPDGRHLAYRCPEVEIPGNQKLAQGPYADAAGKRKLRTLIETRGTGGYALAPGSPPDCHPTGRTYEHVGGPPLTELPVITAAEREVLFRCARSFDLAAEAECGPRQAKAEGGRPGDDFNARGPNWTDILGPHGWVAARRVGAATYWRRPGKDGRGWSATTGYCRGAAGHDLLAVFSSNAHPFEGPSGSRPCTCYSKFSAYALLSHGGDYGAAARELARQGYGDGGGARNGRQGHAPADKSDAGAGAKTFSLGPLTLVPGQPRQNASGKITVPVSTRRGDSPVAPFYLTSAASGRREPARLLAKFLADDAEAAARVDEVLLAVLAWADERLKDAPAAEGPTVREVLKERVPDEWRLSHRTARGAWSEARRAEVTRAEFVSYTPDALLLACGEAADAPRKANGDPVRPDLVRAIEMELKVLWSDLIGTLPHERDVDLPETSAAAAAFRNAMVRLWTRTMTFEVIKDMTKAGDLAARSSLVGRVRSQQKLDPREGDRERWRPVQHAFDAWWRYYHDSEGEQHTLLAMRWTLADQVGVPLPGVTDQGSLTDLGRRYGVLRVPPEGVPAVLSGGTARLAVLSLGLTCELLEQPSEDPEDNPREPGAEG
jgi:putative DNA primase/helicase